MKTTLFFMLVFLATQVHGQIDTLTFSRTIKRTGNDWSYFENTMIVVDSSSRMIHVHTPDTSYQMRIIKYIDRKIVSTCGKYLTICEGKTRVFLNSDKNYFLDQKKPFFITSK